MKTPTSRSLNKTFGSLPEVTEFNNGYAPSSISNISPFKVSSAYGISNNLKLTFVYGPNTYPVQSNGINEYPIYPAAPVIQTFNADSIFFFEGF